MSASEILPALFLGEEPRAVIEAAARVVELSSGRVRKPEGMNRRTGKPERDGLYCARIFGPVAELECLCGKLRGSASAGRICDRCGVLCGERRLRDERWGHIESASPLIHPCLVPQIAAALNLRVKDVKDVLHFAACLSEAGAVVRGEVEGDRGPEAIARRLGARAEAWTLTRVPVTPPGWRGTWKDPQDEGYARLLNRCNRLSRLIELNAPQIILDNEALMSQRAFERLHAAVRAELRARRPVVVAAATPERDALLQAVYDDPDDDAARRAYAEHLDAAGDPRGEFIRRQLASASRSRSPRRELDVLRRNLDRWLAPLGDAVQPNVVFRRGFLAACKTVASGAIARIGDPAWATVEQLETDILELITHPVMRGLRRLTVHYRTLHALCSGSWVSPRIDALVVQIGRCPPPGCEVVTRAEALPGLRALTLVSRSTREEDWTWLDDTGLSRQLERLQLVLPFEHLDWLSLQWWIELFQRHPALAELTVTLGTRMVIFELRREGGLPALKVTLTRGVLERVMLGCGEIAETLARVLLAVDPCGLASVQIRSAGAWFGDELAALARSLRDHFPGGGVPDVA